MAALRLAHVALLAVLSGAALLLITRYGTPVNPSHHRLAALGFAPAAPAVAPGSTSVHSVESSSGTKTPHELRDETAHQGNETREVPHGAPELATNETVSRNKSSTPTRTRPQAPRPVITGDIYVSGHTSPHPELCPGLGGRLALLVLVTSAPAHSQARDAIRLTWGHFARRTDVALAFVVGTATEEETAAALDAEDSLYGDLIRGNFVDSYSNLTLKTVSMLEWASSYCSRAPRLLKTDDDMFINVPRLLAFAAYGKRANATRTVWGRVVKRWLPKRTPSSKYYVSPVQYPARVFPDFATGPAYLLTGDTVRPLYEAALGEPYLRLEDVFVTGVLSEKLKIRREHSSEFYNKKVALHPCAVQRGIAIHMVRYHEQFDLWRKLLDGRSKCSPAAG